MGVKRLEVTRDLVIASYRLLLEREPENEEVVHRAVARCNNVEELRNLFLNSAEYIEKRASPVQHRSTLAPEEILIINEHFNLSPEPVEGFVVDKLGVRTRSSSLWNEAQPLAGTVVPAPLVGNFHGEALEWLGLLKSVRSAKGRFVAMELGAGWGPWVVAGAVAARNMGIEDSFLLAVEADPGHFEFMRQHFMDNGLNPEEHRLLQVGVGDQHGWARWPRLESRNEWGSRPIPIDANGDQPPDGTISDYLGRQFSDFVEVEIVSIVDLLKEQPRWDFVHIDVQGGEAALCQAGLQLFSERVHWLVVGTHSRTIEGTLLSMLTVDGWILVSEEPVRFVFRPNAPTQEGMVDHDGTQVWRNPRLD